MVSGPDTNGDISTLFSSLFSFVFSFLLVGSGTPVDVFTGDLDVVANDPISRGLVTPGPPPNRSGSTWKTRREIENSKGCDVFLKQFSCLFALSLLLSVCLHESLNSQRMRGE